MPLSWIFWFVSALSLSQFAMAEPQAQVSNVALTHALDINHASLKDLNKIKGLGKKRAKAIIQYRQQHGEFHSLNDLIHVKGFSEKRLETFLTKNQGKIATLH